MHFRMWAVLVEYSRSIWIPSRESCAQSHRLISLTAFSDARPLLRHAGILTLFALSYRRNPLGCIPVAILAIGWYFVPNWVEWWVQPQQCVLAVLLLLIGTGLFFYTFVPTLGFLVVPGLITYWSYYGLSLDGVWVFLSLGWLSDYAPHFVIVVVRVCAAALHCTALAFVQCGHFHPTDCVFLTQLNAPLHRALCPVRELLSLRRGPGVQALCSKL